MSSGRDGRTAPPHTAFVALDDDPTGTQAMSGVPLVLEWHGGAFEAALALRAPAVHLLTNTRALSPAAAFARTRDAAASTRAAAPDAHVLLRGDSTLRAHFREEAEALSGVVYPDRAPVAVLALALPAAGRKTIDGVHLVDGPSGTKRVSETEYARDGLFAYRSSRLLDWAEERSQGLFPASDGAELALAELRDDGAESVVVALHRLSAKGVPGALAIDAENDEDIAIAAAGLRAALQAGLPLAIRASPAFAAAIEGNAATRMQSPPRTGAGTLVVCGSYVAGATRQLAALDCAYPGHVVTVDAVELAGALPDREIQRAARTAGELLTGSGIAFVATPRERPAAHTDLESGARIANGLAEIVARMEPQPGVVVSKGGITSAAVARTGLGVDLAVVEGPVATGAALWRCGERGLIVVPGNVGSDRLLCEIVASLRDSG